MRRFLPLLTLAVALTTACNTDLLGPGSSVRGSYALRTINGSTLPYSVSYNRRITQEKLSLNRDGSYDDVAYYDDGTSYTEYGYYTQNNTAITFNDQTDNITYQGSVSGSVLTVISGGYTAVYQKN